MVQGEIRGCYRGRKRITRACCMLHVLFFCQGSDKCDTSAACGVATFLSWRGGPMRGKGVEMFLGVMLILMLMTE